MQVRNCFRGCLQCTNVCLTHPIISGISEVLLALQKYFMRIFYKNTKNSFRALRSKFFPHQSQKGATVSLKICIAGIELWHKNEICSQHCDPHSEGALTQKSQWFLCGIVSVSWSAGQSWMSGTCHARTHLSWEKPLQSPGVVARMCLRAPSSIRLHIQHLGRAQPHQKDPVSSS